MSDDLLEYLEVPHSVAEVAFQFTWSFSKAYQRLRILHAGKVIRKVGGKYVSN